MKVEIDIFGTAEDQSIDEAIVEAAAHELLQRREPRDPDAHGKDRPSTLEMRIMRRVREVQDEEIRAQVRPLVAEALVKPIQKTDGNGKVTKEYNGTDAEEAFRMLGEDIDREAHS